MTKISNLYTLTNYISANSSGNVVIAAPASGYALDVTGTGRFTNDLFLKGDTRVLYFQNSAGTGYPAYISAANNTSLIISANQNIPLDLRTNDVPRIYITSGGYVGMGTTTPSSRLQVEIAAESPATGQIALIAKTSNGINDIFRWYDGSTQLGVFKNSGFVGIGTTSPTGLLHLYGADPAFRIQSSTTGNMQFGQWDGTYNRIQGSGRDFLLINTDATNILLSTNSSERMRITSGGQVLIGQTVASGSVNGIYFRPGIESGFIVTSDVALQLSRLATTGDIQTFYSGSTRVGKIAVGSSTITFESANNGGISVTSGGVLQLGNGAAQNNVFKSILEDSTNYETQFYNSNNKNAFKIGGGASGTYNDGATISLTGSDRYGASTAGMLILSAGNATNNTGFGTIEFRTANTERMRLTFGGNLLVGTTSDSGYSLIVGKVREGGWQTAFVNTASVGTAQVFLSHGDGYGAYVDSGSAGASSARYIFKAVSGGAERFVVRGDGMFYMPGIYNNTNSNAANVWVNSDGSMYRSTSSIKYKKNVQNYSKGLAEILQMRPVIYEGKCAIDEGKIFAGLIAEEIHDLGLTEFVQYAEDGTPDALAYQNMVALLTKAIQELSAKVTALESK